MRLYLGKNHDRLNAKPFDIEMMHDDICLNPIYRKVTLQSKNTNVLMDSGAFQDRKENQRLTFQEALDRQLRLERTIGITAERIVAYDYIEDVEETIKANQFLHSKRSELHPRQLVLMLQGTTPEEYLICLRQTLTIASPKDCIGFGGVAVAGRIKPVRLKLIAAFKLCVLEILARGIRDVHVFGVGTFNILRELGDISPDVNLSCDTSAFEMQSIFGRVIDIEAERWINKYTKEDKFVNYHPCDLTKENITKAVKIIGGI